MNEIKITIADDHEIFRKGLVALFKSQPSFEIIDEAGDGNELMNALKKKQPDVLLLDINMPGSDGISLIPDIKKKFPGIKIILLTMHDEPPFLNKALALGADGYILKTTGDHELFKAIFQVREGKTAVDQFLAGEALRYNMGQVPSKNKLETSGVILTPREEEILKAVARGSTDKEISDMFNISIKTVEKHKLNIKMKTGTKRLAGLIKFALENDYLDN